MALPGSPCAIQMLCLVGTEKSPRLPRGKKLGHAEERCAALTPAPCGASAIPTRIARRSPCISQRLTARVAPPQVSQRPNRCAACRYADPLHIAPHATSLTYCWTFTSPSSLSQSCPSSTVKQRTQYANFNHRCAATVFPSTWPTAHRKECS